jgi:predicted TIM-barrel fold metal-dependent hydrolase
MAYFMYRLDFAQDFAQGRVAALSATPLKMKPSEYIKRQVYATFINESVFLSELHRYGPDNIMWSSDYPHTAAIWPRSQAFIQETFGGLAEDARRKIVHDTAARLYGID